MRRGLNPFEFRASFDPSLSLYPFSGEIVLIPLNSGLHLIAFRVIVQKQLSMS